MDGPLSWRNTCGRSVPRRNRTSPGPGSRSAGCRTGAGRVLATGSSLPTSTFAWIFSCLGPRPIVGLEHSHIKMFGDFIHGLLAQQALILCETPSVTCIAFDFKSRLG